MKPARPPLFVARSTYRRRRLADAARMLPVLGMVLTVLPMLWSPGTDGARSTALDGIYLFAIWGALIGAAAWLAPRLEAAAPDPRDPPEG
jgi:hypothetical protein